MNNVYTRLTSAGNYLPLVHTNPFDLEAGIDSNLESNLDVQPFWAPLLHCRFSASFTDIALYFWVIEIASRPRSCLDASAVGGVDIVSFPRLGDARHLLD